MRVKGLLQARPDQVALSPLAGQVVLENPSIQPLTPFSYSRVLVQYSLNRSNGKRCSTHQKDARAYSPAIALSFPPPTASTQAPQISNTHTRCEPVASRVVLAWYPNEIVHRNFVRPWVVDRSLPA